MATRKTNPGSTNAGSPASFGQNPTTPQSFPSQDHSFTLQTIFELQKSVGELCSEVRLTREAVEKLDGKVDKAEERLGGRLDKIEDKVSVVTHKLYAAAVVVGIFLVVGGFFVNKAWDMAASHLAEVAKSAVSQKPTK